MVAVYEIEHCVPMKSAITERAPMQSPPNAAAVGIYLKNSNYHFNRTLKIIIKVLY